MHLISEMRPFKEILKDLEESGMTKISEKVPSVPSKRTFGVKDGAFSHKKWSSNLNTNKD